MKLTEVAACRLKIPDTAPLVDSASPIVATAVPTASAVPIEVTIVLSGALVAFINASTTASRSRNRLIGTPAAARSRRASCFNSPTGR